MKTVINLHMPQTEAVYIHRVGRTARAGHSGRAVTFVEEDRRMLMKEFVKRAVEAHQQIKTRVVNKAVGVWAWVERSALTSTAKSWRR